MELHLKTIGICLIALSLVHTIFPRQFKWKVELASLSDVNRGMMYVHTFFIATLLLLVGTLCIAASHNITHSSLGRTISLGLGIFFFLRLLAQFFGYSSKTWRGKTFETIVHILFSIFWAYVTVIFFLIYFK
ncbi:MAG: hypothetical protein EOP51_18180 [Sphingobacteriales bacterium]|nr:MAG: hypothetical protein EOP51_18180 [Sphingobacteriales bacterium]